MKTAFLLAPLAALLPALSMAATAPQYTITDLGQITPGSWNGATAISSNGGYIVGRETDNGTSNWPAFTWSASTGVVAMSTLAGHTYDTAYGVNNSGVSVGLAATSSQYTQPVPVMWVNGQISQLKMPTGQTAGRAYDINDAGVAVGSVGSGISETATIFNTVTGKTQVIDALSAEGSFMQTAFSISNTGLVVGSGVTDSGLNVPLVYDSNRGTMMQLAVPAYTGTNSSLAYGISDNGKYVVGTSGNGSQAFIWSASTGTLLAALPSTSTTGNLRAVNDSGVAVGGSGGIYSNPWLYQDGQTYSLSSLIANPDGWNFSSTSYTALGISNDGTIVGWAMHGSAAHAYMLTAVPVPEPASYALMLAGMAAIGFVARRRSKDRQV